MWTAAHNTLQQQQIRWLDIFTHQVSNEADDEIGSHVSGWVSLWCGLLLHGQLYPLVSHHPGQLHHHSHQGKRALQHSMIKQTREAWYENAFQWSVSILFSLLIICILWPINMSSSSSLSISQEHRVRNILYINYIKMLSIMMELNLSEEATDNKYLQSTLLLESLIFWGFTAYVWGKY